MGLLKLLDLCARTESTIRFTSEHILQIIEDFRS